MSSSLYASVLLTVFAPLLCVGATAQPAAPDATTAPALDRTVHLAGNSSFSAALEALRKASGVSVVADGEPLKQAADITFDGPTRQALDRVADAFDYELEMTRASVVTMRKRFRDPGEQPQFHLAEMRQMSHDLVKALSGLRFDPDDDHWALMLQNVARSLGPEQMAALRRGDHLFVRDLGAAERDAIQQAILTRALGGPGTRFRGLELQLTTLSRSVLRAEEAPIGGAPRTPGRRFIVTHVAGGGPAPLVTFVADCKVPVEGKEAPK